MSELKYRAVFSSLSSIFLAALWGCGGGGSSSSLPTGSFQLTVQATGGGTGTVSSNPAGINCGQTCSASFAPGTVVTLTATPAGNSSFAGWSGGGCSGTSPCVVRFNASQQVTATFNDNNELTLSVGVAGTGSGTVSGPSGISCQPNCTASFSAGTQVILTETPAANSAFAGWGGACSSSGTNPSCTVTLNTSQQVTATFNMQTALVLTVSLPGNGSGSVSSTPPGIACPPQPTCSGTFPTGTQVTLTETTGANSNFVGWGGACNGYTSTCNITMNANQQVSGTFNAQNITAINHIIFLAQENRSFDHYFGALREYWAQNGFPDQAIDGLPQFNPGGQPPAIPGCNPAYPPPADCTFDPTNLVTSYHLITQCIENPSPSWNESHMDWDYYDPLGQQPAQLNGVVWTAGHDARAIQPPYNDVDGVRAMGYYDGTDLNYYYFMASNFATSDRWFNPAMTRTQPNREYLIAATSQGYAYPIGTDNNDKALLTAPTIYQELQAANISWKIYVNPGSHCTAPYTAACLLSLSYLQNFQWGQTITLNNIGTIGIQNSDFDTDLKNGTLPQVVQIEPASDVGFDEHPTDFDTSPIEAQAGAAYVASIINEVMTSTSWKDSAFILTYDEFGGLYDHVSPYSTVSPDGIQPVDLLPGDICPTASSGPICDYTYTGYRVPLIVVSPYTKKNYVSHTPADTTAILTFIESRFNLSPLTKRDAAQMNMTEFFDFTNPVWLTPPAPPAQNVSNPCYLDKLP
jgi:phospholipase C